MSNTDAPVTPGIWILELWVCNCEPLPSGFEGHTVHMRDDLACSKCGAPRPPIHTDTEKQP